jgi:hypothetical protein
MLKIKILVKPMINKNPTSIPLQKSLNFSENLNIFILKYIPSSPIRINNAAANTFDMIASKGYKE